MKRTKQSLLLSGASLVLSAALLAGSTFAWFTDSVTNTGNKVQAGTLSIDAVAYDLAKSGENGFTIEGVNGGETFYFEEKGQDLKTEKDPIISEENWEPGVSSAKLLQVTNSGTLAAKIKVDFTVLEKDLTNALWFDFVQVDENGQISGKFTQRPMSTLETFADNLELPLSAGESVQFILVYGMNEEAGNEYQGKSFAADVSILAAQYTEETDGFGSNQYDKDAAYDVQNVADEDSFVQAVNEGKSIRMTQDITLSSEVVFSEDASLYVNGHTLTVGDGTSAIKVAVGKTLTVYGSGTVNGVLYADTKFGNGSNLIIQAGDDFTVNSKSGWAVYAGAGSTVEINGGTYSASAKETSGVIHCLGSALSMKNATVNVEVASVMNATGIHSNAKANYLENVTVNAKYSTAVNFINSYAESVIKGGCFITDQKADDGFNSPTIKFQGKLDISGASITRIQDGILCSNIVNPGENHLVYSDCTFTTAPGALAGYQDIRHKLY